MSRRWLILVALWASPVWAQDPAGQRRQPLQERRRAMEQGRDDEQGREALLRQVTERFMANYRNQAGLTAEQDQKFRVIAMRSFEQRRARQQEEQQLWRALEGQMRPGIAANPDSVTRLLDRIMAVRASALDQARADQRELATFLSPVQRAQLFLQFERLQRNVEDLIRRRMPRGGGAPPDAGP